MRIIHNKKRKKISLQEKGREIAYLTYEYPKDEAKQRNVNLNFLYVKSGYRRKGLATKLLKYFLRIFKHVTWISFWTGKYAEINKSYGLYSKLGFKQLARQADYYEKGIGTRLFVKRISK